MNNAEQGSVQTEDCYCVLVYSFWKHNQIDMDRAQKARMVISCWKGVKIHCRSQNNTFQSLHRICSSAHKEETKKRSWCFSKAEAGSSWLCSLCRLDFSGCAQAAVAAGAGCCRITDHRTHPEQLWHSPFTLHAWEKSCQNYKKMIYIYIFNEGDLCKNAYLLVCSLTSQSWCKKQNSFLTPFMGGSMARN